MAGLNHQVHGELALQLLFCGLLNPWATMIRMSWARAASVEETLALWAASLREIKQRIRPLFTQERVATNAGLFLEGLLGDEQRKTGWMRAEAAGDPGRCRLCDQTKACDENDRTRDSRVCTIQVGCR